MVRIPTETFQKVMNIVAQLPWVQVQAIMKEVDEKIRPCECEEKHAKSEPTEEKPE